MVEKLTSSVSESEAAFEKGREYGKVSNQPFRGDFFFQIIRHIGIEQALWTIGQVDRRQIAVVQHALQIEFTPDLDSGQAVQLVAHRPSAQQIGVAAFHLARARAAESEADGAVFMQPVGFVEERRDLLDLVDDHMAHGFLRCDLSTEQLRVLQIASVLLRLE